jgi:hypothetical protein
MQSVVTAAAAHAKKNGSRRVEALFTMQLAWLHVECGDYESARNLCQQAFEASGEPTSGVGVVLCHVIAAMAAIGLHNADMTLEFARRARSANTQTDPLGHALAEISALQAHVMKHNLTDIRHSMHRLAQLSANLREQTWKAIALAACAEAAVETGELKLARQYSAAAMQLVEGAKLPLAQWRVEAAAAEIAEKSHSTRAADMDAAQLREKSKRSRQELYNSLGVQDPLRQFAKTEAPALQVMTALGES